MSLPPGSLGRAAPAVPLGGDPAPATQPVQDSGMGATGAAGVISRRRLSVDRSPGYRGPGGQGCSRHPRMVAVRYPLLARGPCALLAQEGVPCITVELVRADGGGDLVPRP